MSELLKLGLIAVVIYYTASFFFGNESGCDKYASKFSCNYVEKKATYDVYYWRDVFAGKPEDEKYIGSVIGLSQCRDMAISHANYIKDKWSERSYICMLKKDGRSLEKHRL
jgi:hypothetical protein